MLAVACSPKKSGSAVLQVMAEPAVYTLVPIAVPADALAPRAEGANAKLKLVQLCTEDKDGLKGFTEQVGSCALVYVSDGDKQEGKVDQQVHVHVHAHTHTHTHTYTHTHTLSLSLPHSQATQALDEAFRSFDTRRNGRLSRSEYNALLKQTDGEECEDDVWEFIVENFDTEEGELTRRGFFQIYTQMVADEESDSAVYPHFEHLGFNRKLQLDEAVLWHMTCYCEKEGALTKLELNAFDKDKAQLAADFAEAQEQNQ